MLQDMRVLAVVSLLAAGCSATVVDDARTDEVDALSVHGSIAVERVVQLQNEALLEHGRVSARFLRVSGLDVDTAERLVGRPSVDDRVGCSFADPVTEHAPVAPRGGSIELLDVGEIVLRILDPGEPTVLPLAPRAFPDVGELVSGVVYTSRDDTTALAARATYLIETSGSDRIDGFVVQVEAPAAPGGVRLGGIPIESGELQIDSGEAIAVEWERGAPGDWMELNLSSPDDDLGIVRCVFTDAGSAEVPAALVAFAPGAIVDVAVHRHRRTAVQVDDVALAPGGIDQAVVDFDFVVASRVAIAE
jgi:hypothetical protein